MENTHYHALVIAAQDYLYTTKLNKPIQDADSLIKNLTTFYQFDKANITLVRNPLRSNLIEKLDSLTEVLTENDNLLIFYAGHGYWDDKLKQGFWFPIDAKPNSKANWFSNDELKQRISGMKCKHILLVTDACFAGSLFREAKVEPTKKTNKPIDRASLQIEFAPLYNKLSRQAMTSGKLTKVEGESTFLKYFLQMLKENNKLYFPASELFNFFSNIVINNTKQIPELGVVHDTGDKGGEFIFIRKK